MATPTSIPRTFDPQSDEWYSRLRGFFPVEEMKYKDHLDSLLSQPDIKHYYLEETDDYIVLYVDHPENNFIHIDYLFVSEHLRGKGLGSQIIEALKVRFPHRFFILEAENENCDENPIIIQKRLQFYAQRGFIHSPNILYTRTHVVTNQPIRMDIHFIPPQTILAHLRNKYNIPPTHQTAKVIRTSDIETVLSQNDSIFDNEIQYYTELQEVVQQYQLEAFNAFSWVYSNIHSYRAVDWYKQAYQPCEEVLRWKPKSISP